MRRWAFLTVLFYVCALVALTMPVIWFCNREWGHEYNSFNIDNIFVLYREWGYWLWVAIMALGQLLLLLVPLDISRERPVARRKLLVPTITAAFLFANLVFAGVFCIFFAFFGDKAPDFLLVWANYGLPEPTGEQLMAQTASHTGLQLDSDTRYTLAALSIVILLWIIWGVVFHRLARNADPGAHNQRLARWLLRGSILEFLVALTSHIVVRNRGDCCAPAGTFWGIACGLAIMFLCFGPGVFFLLAARFKRLQPVNRT